MKLRLLIVLSLVVVLAGLVLPRTAMPPDPAILCCGNCCYTTHTVKQGEYLKLIGRPVTAPPVMPFSAATTSKPEPDLPRASGSPSPTLASQPHQPGPGRGNLDQPRPERQPQVTRNYNSVNFNWGSKAVGSGRRL